MLATKRLKSVHGASTEPTTAAAAAAAAVAEATVRYGRSSASGRSRVEQDTRRRSTSTRCQATNCHTFGCKRCRVAAPRMVASTGAKADEQLQSGGGQVGTRCLRISCFKFGCGCCSCISFCFHSSLLLLDSSFFCLVLFFQFRSFVCFLFGQFFRFVSFIFCVFCDFSCHFFLNMSRLFSFLLLTSFFIFLGNRFLIFLCQCFKSLQFFIEFRNLFFLLLNFFSFLRFDFLVFVSFSFLFIVILFL